MCIIVYECSWFSSKIINIVLRHYYRVQLFRRCTIMFRENVINLYYGLISIILPGTRSTFDIGIIKLICNCN